MADLAVLQMMTINNPHALFFFLPYDSFLSSIFISVQFPSVEKKTRAAYRIFLDIDKLLSIDLPPVFLLLLRDIILISCAFPSPPCHTIFPTSGVSVVRFICTSHIPRLTHTHTPRPNRIHTRRNESSGFLLYNLYYYVVCIKMK